VNKPPAFQFYVKDWLSSTAALSPEARGAFIDLMAWSWDNGPLPDSNEKRARLIRVSRTIERKLWSEIESFWKPTDAGFVVPRLERQRQELAKYREEQVEKGRKGGNATARNRAATATALAATGPQPESSSSSSSSEDQEQDQEQRAKLATFSERGRSSMPDSAMGQRSSGFSKLGALPTENQSALVKIAIEVQKEFPDDPPSEWAAKMKETAAKAGIFYDGPSANTAMEKARHLSNDRRSRQALMA
jgi:uncharacterized protein YdaU (DUF1376 family)